jgi:hypothetical protein
VKKVLRNLVRGFGPRVRPRVHAERADDEGSAKLTNCLSCRCPSPLLASTAMSAPSSTSATTNTIPPAPPGPPFPKNKKYSPKDALDDLPRAHHALNLFMASYMVESEEYCKAADPKSYVYAL